MRNFDNLSINYFFAHACTQYFPCLITTEKKQRNNKTTKTSQPLDKNKNLKQCKQANKKKKPKKTGFVTEIA